ncbi:MAG: hypothetical protein LIO93_06965 [Bacteroidales bacterium]|nr:hypothetical protein [Bacteroidales bacterium]
MKALEILPDSNHHHIKSNVYNFLSTLEENNKNYLKALDFKTKYIKHYSAILAEKRESEIKIIENKYNYEQTQNRNNQLLIEKQNNSLIILALTLTIIIILFYSYWRHNKEKSKTLQLELTAMEAEQKYTAIQSMAQSFDEKERSLRTAVLSHYDILKKIALLQEDDQLNDKSHYKRSPLERINAIVYGKNKPNWDMFFDSIKTFYGEIIEKINTTFPDLDKLERNVCYLSYMEFTNSEMATLLGYTLNTIAKKKSTLRKKIGISDRGNIKVYLDSYFKNIPN